MARFGCAALCVLVAAILIFLVVRQDTARRTPLSVSSVKIEVGGGGHGSGVQILPGYFLTAAHVAALSPMTVRTAGGETAPAELLWMNSFYDVALLRVVGLKNVAVSPLRCEAPIVGLRVKSLANPGPHDFASSWGRVSAGTTTRFHWKAAILVDILDAPGSSGGPILDMQNRVVGIVVGGVTRIAGFSIVVPSEVICALLARPRNNE